LVLEALESLESLDLQQKLPFQWILKRLIA
jgi:hypothetical protein